MSEAKEAKPRLVGYTVFIKCLMLKPCTALELERRTGFNMSTILTLLDLYYDAGLIFKNKKVRHEGARGGHSAVRWSWQPEPYFHQDDEEVLIEKRA